MYHIRRENGDQDEIGPKTEPVYVLGDLLFDLSGEDAGQKSEDQKGRQGAGGGKNASGDQGVGRGEGGGVSCHQDQRGAGGEAVAGSGAKEGEAADAGSVILL